MIAATGFEVRAKQKRRCFQRRFGAPTRGPAHFDWRLAGATRSGSAGGEAMLAVQKQGYAYPVDPST